jgi:hypothetical protein
MTSTEILQYALKDTDMGFEKSAFFGTALKALKAVGTPATMALKGGWGAAKGMGGYAAKGVGKGGFRNSLRSAGSTIKNNPLETALGTGIVGGAGYGINEFNPNFATDAQGFFLDDDPNDNVRGNLNPFLYLKGRYKDQDTDFNLSDAMDRVEGGVRGIGQNAKQWWSNMWDPTFDPYGVANNTSAAEIERMRIENPSKFDAMQKTFLPAYHADRVEKSRIMRMLEDGAISDPQSVALANKRIAELNAKLEANKGLQSRMIDSYNMGGGYQPQAQTGGMGGMLTNPLVTGLLGSGLGYLGGNMMGAGGMAPTAIGGSLGALLPYILRSLAPQQQMVA